MHISIFDGAAVANRIRTCELTLLQLKDYIDSTKAQDKAGLPLLKLARFGDVPNAKGNLRHEANMVAISGVELDYDGGQMTFGEAVKRLRTAQVRCLVYTTPSHRGDAPRWRVLAPCSDELPVEQRAGLVSLLNGVLGGLLAPESWVAAQVYYAGHVVGREFELVELDGWPVDSWALGTLVEPVGPAVGVREAAVVNSDLTDVQVRDLRAALLAIPSDDRGLWVSFGLALHRHGDVGLGLWLDWSMKSEKFDPDDVLERWESFAVGRGDVTINSIFAEAAGRGWINPMVAGVAGVDEFEVLEPAELPAREVLVPREEREGAEALALWRAELERCEDALRLRTTLVQGMQLDLRLRGAVELGPLTYDVQARLKVLGEKWTIGDVRRLLRRNKSGTVVEETPDWATGWHFVTTGDYFWHEETKRKLTPMGFNALYTRMVEPGHDGLMLPAAQLVLTKGLVPTAHREDYRPDQPDEVFEDERTGLPHVNSYRRNSVPELVPRDGRVERILREHLEALVSVGAAAVLIRWLAWNVQLPGRKIRWGPLIAGLPGDGKTLIGEMLAAAMGAPNVGIVSAQVLHTQFSAWAIGYAVNVLEEIKMVGHNRHDVLEALKPNISNNEVNVHPKGVDPYKMRNVTNYLAFTNHRDALPLDNTDRRWWVLFSEFLMGRAKLPGGEYFTRLHAVIREHPGEIRAWLLSVDLEGFDADGRAPESEGKDIMASLAVNADDQMVSDLIEDGGLGFSTQVISSSCLFEAFFRTQGFRPKTSAVNKLLVALGYAQLKDTLKWDGKTHRVWTREKITDTDVLRELLEDTRTKVRIDDFF